MLFVARPAQADDRAVVVLGEPVLVEAVSGALAPWGLRVITPDEARAPTDVAAVLDWARATARRTTAVAVVWTSGGPGASLVVYDAGADEVVVRSVAGDQPLDEARAASIALSVKTILRSTDVAPPSEQVRRGTGATSPPDASPAARHHEAAPASPAVASAVSARRRATSKPPPTAPRGGTSPVMGALRLELATNARLVDLDTLHAEPRAQLALALFPKLSAPLGHHLGAFVAGELGPGISVQSARFVGTYHDVAVGGGVRGRVAVGPLLLEGGTSLSMHFTGIRGDVSSPSTHVASGQVDPSLDLGAAALVPLSRRVDAGLVARASWFLRHQVYTLGTEPLLGVPPLEPALGIRLGVTLD